MSVTFNYKSLQKDTIYRAPNYGRLYIASSATASSTAGDNFSTTIYDPFTKSNQLFENLTPVSWSFTTSQGYFQIFTGVTIPATSSHGVLRLVGTSWLNKSGAGVPSDVILARGFRYTATGSGTIADVPGVYAGLYAEHYLTFLGGYASLEYFNGLFDIAILTRQFWSPTQGYPGIAMIDTPVVMPINYHIASHTTMEVLNNYDLAIAPAENSSVVRVSFDPASTSAPFVGDFSATILNETTFFSMYNSYNIGARVSINLKMHRAEMLAMGEEPVGWMLFDRSDGDSPWEYSGFVEGDTYVAIGISVAQGSVPTKLIIPITRDVFIDPRVIEFDPNGGSLAESLRRKTVDVGKPYGTLPTPSRFGYNFLGWFTQQQTGGDQILPTTIVPDLGGNE